MEKRIFNIKNGVIEVYSFIPNNMKIKDFKIKEMNSLPEEERFIIKDNSSSWFTSKEGIIYSCGGYNLKKIVGKNKIKNNEDLELLIRKYLNGELITDPIKIVHRDDNNERLIYLSPFKNTTLLKIQLTEELYQLELLEREEYSKEELQEDSLENLRELYDIGENPIDKINIIELEKAYNNNLIEGEFEEKLESIENIGKIFRKLK